MFSANNASIAAATAVAGAIHHLVPLVLWFAALSMAAGVINTTSHGEPDDEDAPEERP